MAKSKPSARQQAAANESKSGLIVALLFFIVATIISVFVAYGGYSQQEELRAKEKKSAALAKQYQNDRDREQMKRLLYGFVLGTESGEGVQTDLSRLREAYKGDYDAVLQELVTMLQEQAKQVRDSNKEGSQAMADFERDLRAIADGLSQEAGKGDTRNWTEAIKDLASKLGIETKALREQVKVAKQAQQTAEAEKAQAESRNKTLDNTIKMLRAEIAKLENERDLARKELTEQKQELDNRNDALIRQAADNLRAKQEELKKLEEKIASLNGLSARLKNELERFKRQSQLELDEPRGKIERVAGGSVFINLGSYDKLKPGITFSVLPATVGGKNVINRQRKGAIEVIEVVGPKLAKARIVEETNPFGDPVIAGDLIYNPAWQPGLKTRVVLAGVIDLNGDGTDDTLEFVKILERQGVEIDGYLDLRDLTLKGRNGRDGKVRELTDFLILGEEPQVSAATRGDDGKDERRANAAAVISKLRDDAQRVGAELISYRRFIASMGLKVPATYRPVDYGSPASISQPTRPGYAMPK
jgi:hypothetical protein